MRKKSKRSKKSNRVSWASGDDLCQVKLFSSEDCPAIVGLKSQEDLQEAQTSATSHSDTVGPNEVPPGFECRASGNQSGLEPSYVSQIQWRCPSKFVLSHTWHVASGEESEEVKNEKLRELKVLEAVYPRFSAIPSSPSVSLEAEREYYDDSQTPVVSIIPIEEEESVDTLYDNNAGSVNTTISSQPPPMSDPSSFLSGHDFSQPNSTSSVKPLNVAGVASVALAEAIRTSNEKGSLIDTDLLIKILSDKQIIQRLIVDGPSTSTTSSVSEPRAVNPSPLMAVPTLSNQRPTVQDSLRTTVNAAPVHQDSQPVFQQVVKQPISAPSPERLPRPSDGNSFRMPNQVRASMEAMGVTVRPPVITTTSTFAVHEPVQQPVKDMNYYKNLIRQHGEGKEENKHSIHAQNGQKHYHHYESKPAHNFNLGESKSKITKPCMYFNTPRGCLKGANCPFQHDVPVQWRAGTVMEAHTAKRMKLSGEINGGMLV